METQKYKYISYFKYVFTVEGEDGEMYKIDDDFANSGDIYRLYVEKDGDMTKKGDTWYIDGIPFKPVSM